MKKIAILIDSSGGVYESELQKYKDSFFIPINITDSEGEIYKDSEKTLTNEKFWNLMETKDLKTSAINAGEMRVVVVDILEKYDQVVFLGLSKRLSSQHSILKQLENDSDLHNKLFVIDTCAVSGILWKIFLEVHKHIQNGGSTSEVQEIVDKINDNYACFFVPKNINYLKKGGRISPAVAALASIAKIVPVLTFNGMIDASSKCRTIKKGFKVSLEELIEKTGSDTLKVYTSKYDEDVMNELKSVAEKLKIKTIEEYHLANVISVHTGPNTFGLIMWRKGI